MVFHLSAPPNLTAWLHSLPPILHKPFPTPIPSCSKAPRGLFVLLREGRIYTANSISPSLSPRQRSSRYTIRAGQNLPDKEFRYLRTVIVTAAVHRGFRSQLSPLPLTFRHRAGVTPYTSPKGLAECYDCDKQSLEPIYCAHLTPGTKPGTTMGPLLPKLRGQFAEFLRESSLARLSALTLAHLCRLSVRAPTHQRLEDFLGTMESATYHPKRASRQASPKRQAHLTILTGIHLPPGIAIAPDSLS